MALGMGSDEEKRQDEVLSKVDALLRRHRGGGIDAILDGTDDAAIPTLTEIIGETPAAAASDDAGLATEPMVSLPERDARSPLGATETPSARQRTTPAKRSESAPATEIIERLRDEIERAVAAALAKQLPHVIQEQVMPEVMLQLGEGLNRLRDALRTTVRSVVQETIEQEVKRALKALIKEREQR